MTARMVPHVQRVLALPDYRGPRKARPVLRIGSLFSGAGGLDLAVEAVFGGRTVWHSELDPAASKVLAHRWPGVPNLGDITTIDWDEVEPVDVMCGGYPCQPFSAAGQRKGTDDERHLWPYFAEAIRRVRPRFVILENVAGHRSMGFDTVLGDLATARYDAQWCSVRASDVGAPHRRERLFVLATDTTRNRRHEGRPEPARQQRRPDAASSSDGHVDLLPTPAACNPNDGETPETWLARRDAVKEVTTVAEMAPLLCTPSAADGGGGHLNRSGDRRGELLLPGQAREISTTWGKYEPAIRRWEQIAGPAPSPTEPNRNGNPRLSAAFSEWLMGWPAGWVTDPAIGISRNDQLRIIGNGVVPQQAVAALRWLLRVAEVAA